MKNIFIILLFVWMQQSFNYFDGAFEFMNKLPEKQREKAYIISLASARSSLITGYYVVVYPDESVNK